MGSDKIILITQTIRLESKGLLYYRKFVGLYRVWYQEVSEDITFEYGTIIKVFFHSLKGHIQYFSKMYVIYV